MQRGFASKNDKLNGTISPVSNPKKISGLSTDETEYMRKEAHIKAKQPSVSYFRTVRTVLEEEVATLHP